MSRVTPWQLGSQILQNSLCRNPQCHEGRSDKRLPVHSFVVSKGHDISPRTLVFILQYHTENLFCKRNVIFYSLPILTPEDFFLLSTCLCACLSQPLRLLSLKAAKLQRARSALLSIPARVPLAFLLQTAIGDSFFFETKTMQLVRKWEEGKGCLHSTQTSRQWERRQMG